MLFSGLHVINAPTMRRTEFEVMRNQLEPVSEVVSVAGTSDQENPILLGYTGNGLKPADGLISNLVQYHSMTATEKPNIRYCFDSTGSQFEQWEPRHNINSQPALANLIQRVL